MLTTASLGKYKKIFVKTTDSKNINPDQFLLTFKANGVSVFVTDIHRDVYRQLEALFIIDRGTFKQYFTEQAYNRALNRGLRFYKNNARIKNYKKQLQAHIENFKNFFNYKVKGQGYISKQVLQQFFRNTVKLCKDYTKMNIEFTDKAFAAHDRAISRNLRLIMSFKDQVRTFMNKVLFEKDGYANTLFKILAKQFNTSIQILENSTQMELLQLYLKKPGSKHKILKRQKAFISVWDDRSPIEGQKAIEIIKKFKKPIRQTDKIYGQSANKGKIVGTIKIIPVNYTDLTGVTKAITLMKKGDVLVAETTAPELLTACKKASAIVTDLGGLMSHATIISRELKIPCIVGTKTATKIFKDGDRVLVDANHGVVKKIN